MHSAVGWRAFAFALALAYWMANAGLHLVFSNWVTSPQPTPFGDWVPLHSTREVAWLVSGGLLVWLAWRGRGNSWPTWCAWLLLAVAVLASNRWLLTTYVEAIHYPQYAIITLLFAWALDPARERWPLLEVWLLVFWLSVLDEAYQYLSLAARQGTYFDFNDLWLNQLGVLAGLLLYYGFRERPESAMGMPRVRRWLLGTSGAIALSAITLGATGRLILNPDRDIPPGGFHPDDTNVRLYLQREPGLYGNWQRTFTDGYYFVLSPLQGTILLVLAGIPCLPRRRSALAVAVQ